MWPGSSGRRKAFVFFDPHNGLTWMVRKADMPIQKLTPEIITAAILGFEEQKRHIDSKIAELRAMLSGGPGETAALTSPGRSKQLYWEEGKDLDWDDQCEFENGAGESVEDPGRPGRAGKETTPTVRGNT